jgi:hypothetical protein
VKAQQEAILRLKDELESKEVELEETKNVTQVLERDLEDARLDQTRLEDELELRKEEIRNTNIQNRDQQKANLDLLKLMESEVVVPQPNPFTSIR